MRRMNASERVTGMSDRVEAAHASAGSVWIRIAILPLLALWIAT
jgi:hypothetical protein